jgi:hypothetical protein
MKIGHEAKKIKLSEAVQLFLKEKSAPSNSYNWYRQSAQSNGTVLFGESEIKAEKLKGSWYVDEKAFTKSIEKIRNKAKQIKKVASDYKKGNIHGKNGEEIKTEWGSYKIYKNFRLVTSDCDSIRKRSDGDWYCNDCNIKAKLEHEKEECHSCSDWNGCGRDCTLSKVFCTKCGKSLKI